MGSPGAQVIYSTGLFWSSHRLAASILCLPFWQGHYEIPTSGCHMVANTSGVRPNYRRLDI